MEQLIKEQIKKLDKMEQGYCNLNDVKIENIEYYTVVCHTSQKTIAHAPINTKNVQSNNKFPTHHPLRFFAPIQL